ncbi:peptide-methionine (S)-S-oxide reductase MsrA [Alteribacillus sp. HJP-4]|uniref:peptide-methionine (S)-S-oxide reductase MsrA n=1 Tax=Alteribacillus sp. HJP-4 TaxID=2775394 RepID=UPI0035CCE0AF
MRWKRWIFVLVPIMAVAAVWLTYSSFASKEYDDARGTKQLLSENQSENYEKATFAGGCFWCMEPPFEKLPGVVEAVSGYTGGQEEDPVYEEVAAGETGHVEAVQIIYNPEQITYGELLEVFWRQIDPTDNEGMFVDRGHQYTSAIFVHDENQKKQAEKSLQNMEESERFDSEIVTPIEDFEKFYQAEDYHQDYYKKNEGRYSYYRGQSGRDDYLDKVWGDDREYKVEDSSAGFKDFNKEARLDELTELQYSVTQEDDTEEAFNNEYHDNKEEGIYVDIVSGEPLFSSEDQFDSGTGWPSFTKPLESSNIVLKEDDGLFGVRVEVRSKNADSHLGHVFEDGPEPTGLRYCMNSAAMDFIPVNELEEKGYSEYEEQFE